MANAGSALPPPSTKPFAPSTPPEDSILGTFMNRKTLVLDRGSQDAVCEQLSSSSSDVGSSQAKPGRKSCGDYATSSAASTSGFFSAEAEDRQVQLSHNHHTFRQFRGNGVAQILIVVLVQLLLQKLFTLLYASNHTCCFPPFPQRHPFSQLYWQSNKPWCIPDLLDFSPQPVSLSILVQRDCLLTVLLPQSLKM